MSLRDRRSIRDKLAAVVSGGEESVRDTLASLDKESEEYKGLRWHSKEEQQEQDQVLEEYHQFIKVFFSNLDGLTDDSTDEAIDRSCFPDDHSSLYLRARRFLIFVIDNAVPRSSEDKDIAHVPTTRYREILQWWVERKYVERNAEPPESERLHHELTEAMHGAAMKRQRGKAGTTCGKDIPAPEEEAVTGRTGLVRGGEGFSTSQLMQQYPDMLTEKSADPTEMPPTDQIVAAFPNQLTDEGPCVSTDQILAAFPNQLTDDGAGVSTDAILQRFPGLVTDKEPAERDDTTAG